MPTKTPATAPAADKPPRKARTPRLTNAERSAAWKAAGGKCYVFGTDVDPFSSFAVEDGHVIGEEAKRIKGDSTLEALRHYVRNRLARARQVVESTNERYRSAMQHELDLRDLYAPIIADGDAVVFAGEKAQKPASDQVSALAEQPAGEVNRKSAS